MMIMLKQVKYLNKSGFNNFCNYTNRDVLSDFSEPCAVNFAFFPWFFGKIEALLGECRRRRRGGRRT